jgi:HAD superfamily hydrolase (TIGR01509 family)
MSQAQIKTIIFDLVGVLFSISKSRVLRRLGSKDLILYYLRKGKNPIDEGIMLLDRMRKEVPGQFQEVVAYKGVYLPNCILQWNQGVLTRNEAFGQIQQYFTILDQQHYFTNKNHQRVILDLLSKLFSSQLGIEVYRPVRSTVNLIKELKKSNKYQIYLLSNIDQETFEGIKELYPEIFDLFDGLVTSWHSKLLKPDVAIFEYLLNTYNLSASECCFVDDQIENLNTAQKLGMQTILCTNCSLLPRIFKEKKLL